MPLPSRRKGEGEQKFVSRAMGSETMKSEFPKQKQRVAVAFSQARRAIRNGSRKSR
jgi:hypothetical protein